MFEVMISIFSRVTDVKPELSLKGTLKMVSGRYHLLYEEENEDGKPVFRHFPLEKLDGGVPCAAFSKKKEQWYPRTLVFQSAMIPASAFPDARGTGIEDLSLEDGIYEAEVSLEGKGRLKLISPPITGTSASWAL